MKRWVPSLLFVGVIFAEPVVGAEPQSFSGTAHVSSDSRGWMTVHLDVPPVDGIIDKTWEFQPNDPIEGGIPVTTLSASVQYYSEGLGRLILDGTGGELHLDLAATYLPIVQSPGAAAMNVVAEGVTLRYRDYRVVGGARTLSRTEHGVAPAQLMSRLTTEVTRAANGTVTVTSALVLQARDDSGHDSVVPLTPAVLEYFKAIAQDAFNRGNSGTNITQDCYSECMEERDCEFASAVGGPLVSWGAVTLTQSNGWGVVGGMVGSLACYAANALGCDMGCGVGGGSGQKCPAGSTCEASCGAFETEVGTCMIDDQQDGDCCEPTCWNPPFGC